MKRLLFFLLLLSSVSYGQRHVYSRATIGGPSSYQFLVESDIPNLNFNKINSPPWWNLSGTSSLSGNTTINGSANTLTFSNLTGFNLSTASGGGFFAFTGGMTFQVSGNTLFSTLSNGGIQYSIDGTGTLSNLFVLGGATETVSEQSSGTVFRRTLTNAVQANVGFEWLSKGAGVYSFRGNSTQSTRISGDEDTDNGANTGTIIWPSSIASNRTWTFQDASGTIAHTEDLFVNPATTDEDLIKYTGTGYERIPVGSDGQVLGISSGVVGWVSGSSVTPAALTRTNDTNVTLTLGGTPSTALLQATSITAGWTGLLAGSRGGTNNAFFEVTGPTTSTKTFTFPNTNATVLTSAAAVSIGQGGTNNTSFASSMIPYFNGTGLVNTGSSSIVQGVSWDNTNGIFKTARSNSATNSQLTGLVINAISTGTMADGFASLLSFRVQDTDGIENPIAAVAGVRDGADNSGKLSFQTISAGTGTAHMNISASGNIAIGNANTTATAQLQVTGNGTTTGNLLIAEASDGTDRIVVLDNGTTTITGNISASNLLSGTYTPTLTNTTNVAASTAYVTGYYRIGNAVTVYGKVDIDATLAASEATELGLSLPVASDLAGEEDLGGNAISDGIASLSARIRGDATNNRASIVFKAISLSNDSYSFEFSYQVK